MSNIKFIQNFKNLDILGILCSVACAVHCALTLLLAFLAPTLTVQFENEWIHILLLILIIPISGTVFYRHQKNHKKFLPTVLAVSGVFFLITAVLSEKVSYLQIEGIEVGLTLLGSLSLILGHLFNMKYLRNSFLNRV